MDRPPLREFAQLRRALPIVAAVLMVSSLAFPMWSITVDARQYVELLHAHVYAYPRITGDVWELAELNQYVGFYFPDPVYWEPNYPVHPRAVDVPEWSAGPFAFVAVSALAIFVAIAPTTEKLKRGLKWQLIGTVAVFTIMLADIQYRLYQTGHTLDPDAPMIGVEGFTPPILGTYEVANLTTTSYLDVGAWMAGSAVLLLLVAYYFRNTDATFGDVPELLSGGFGKIRRRIVGKADRETTSTGSRDAED